MKVNNSMAALTIVLSLISTVALAQQMITVTLENRNTSANVDQFEVYDRVCGRVNGTYTLKGGTSIKIKICKGGNDKGSVKIRNPNLNNDWAGTDFVAPGETISR